MGKARRYLVWSDLRHSWTEEFQTAQAARFAQFPEADQYTDEEAEDFLLAGFCIDGMTPEDTLRVVRKAGLTPPVELAYDTYRLGRYLFRRWRDPGVREGFLTRGMHVPALGINRMRHTRDRAAMQELVYNYGPAPAIAIFRSCQLDELIPDLRSTFKPGHEDIYTATVQYGKMQLHRYLTEPEPARLPSRWEQQKLVRRLHFRDLQLHSLKRSRRHLRGERSALLNRLREIGLQEQPELKELAAELGVIRAEGAEAERRHQEALESQRMRCRQQIERLRSELAAAEADFERALSLRRSLLGREGRVKS